MLRFSKFSDFEILDFRNFQKNNFVFSKYFFDELIFFAPDFFVGYISRLPQTYCVATLSLATFRSVRGLFRWPRTVLV